MLTVAGGVVLGWIAFAANLPAPRGSGQWTALPATSVDRFAAATPLPGFSSFPPTAVDLPSIAIRPRVLVKPATVVKWDRRPSDLQAAAITQSWTIQDERRNQGPDRRMSRANPLWGAPRIRGEQLKLDIEVSQATVGRHLPRRRTAPPVLPQLLAERYDCYCRSRHVRGRDRGGKIV
jgi:hypothetical protein